MKKPALINVDEGKSPSRKKSDTDKPEEEKRERRMTEDDKLEKREGLNKN